MKSLAIKEFCEHLQENLKSQIETVTLENPDIISKASKCLVIIGSFISQLKQFVYQYRFQGMDEEISFFKEQKPVILSQYFYYDKVFSLKLAEPFNGSDALRVYFHQCLSELQEYVKENTQFYKYCLSNSTHLDDKYFTRTEKLLSAPDIDAKFSTGYDNVLAKILAYQMVKEHLVSQLQNLDADNSDRISSLKWTGTKSALIELIYALQSVDAVNNGKADIKQIADSFEHLFNISLGNYYRHFQEIRLRKNGKTNFLDDMREKLIQRLDDFA